MITDATMVYAGAVHEFDSWYYALWRRVQ